MLVTLQSRIQRSTCLAMGWLWGCRNADYGWADHPAGPSAPSNTCEVIIGMRRCGLTHESRAVRESAGYVIKHLQALGENVTKETRNLSLPIILLGELGLKDKRLGLEEGISLLKRYQRSEGGWSLRPREEACNAFDTSLAIRALQLHEAKAEEITRGLSYLLRQQNTDGGWGFYHGNPSNPAPTAHALLALLEEGSRADSEAVEKAARYLSEKQLPDGSWEISWEDDPLHHHDKWFHFTTPWAILALSDRRTKAPRSRLERAIDSLIRSQDETGGWRALEGYDPFTWATGNALMALSVRFKPQRVHPSI